MEKQDKRVRVSMSVSESTGFASPGFYVLVLVSSQGKKKLNHPIHKKGFYAPLNVNGRWKHICRCVVVDLERLLKIFKFNKLH